MAAFVKVREPESGVAVNRKTFTCTFDRDKWKQALQRDGCYHSLAPIYLGRSPKVPGLRAWKSRPRCCGNGTCNSPVEEAFKTLKSDLNLRPIHQSGSTARGAHILVAFLGYCLAVTLRLKLRSDRPGLTPQAVLQSLAAIQMVDVEVPTADGRTLLLRRHTEPEAPRQMILEKLKLTLPAQPPPRIRPEKSDHRLDKKGMIFACAQTLGG